LNRQTEKEAALIKQVSSSSYDMYPPPHMTLNRQTEKEAALIKQVSEREGLRESRRV